MKTFEDLIELLKKVGFKEVGGGSLVSGYFYTASDKSSVNVCLGEKSEVSIVIDNSGYTVTFYYVLGNILGSNGLVGKLAKTETVNEKDLESFLLTSIIRDSFLTEEEEEKISNDQGGIQWQISWSQTF